ncbi:MAG: hypothetical protein NC401_17630, partial [Ruminococcus sp.]|nr:hypothetical protein [Ruminococcus sp.]
MTAAEPGDYSVTVIPQTAYVFETLWEDDKTAEPITFNWKIAKAAFPKPGLKKAAFKFDGTLHTVESNENFDGRVMKMDGTVSATAVDEYEVVFSLLDKKSAAWDDGTDDDVVVKWRIIEGEPLSVPEVLPIEFPYNGGACDVVIGEYDENLIKQSGVESAVDAGVYEVYFDLIDPDSSIWDDNTYARKIVKWEIKKQVEKLVKPRLEKSEYEYDAVDYTPEIVGFIGGKMTALGDTTKRKANGKYEITVRLADNKNYDYQWEDGSTEDVVLNWSVTPITIPVPRVPETVFYYGAYASADHYISHAWRQPVIEGFSEIAKYITSEGVIGKKAVIANEWNVGARYVNDGNYYGTNQWALGKYYIRIVPIDPESCTWEDSGTADKIEFEWSIVREIKLIPKPELLEGLFEYDGTEKKPVLSNTDVGVVVSGDLKKTEVGEYTVTAAPDRYDDVRDIYDYRWEDNTIEPIPYKWEIVHGGVAVPKLDEYSYPYDGKPHQPVVEGFDKNTMTMSGYAEKTAAGDYDIVFSLKDPDSGAWSDGTVGDKVVTWHITKTKFKKPVISPEYLTYDGEVHTVEFIENEGEHSFVVSGFLPDVMASDGDVKATVVGDYTAVVRLKDPESASWEDGGTENVELPWKIIKKIVKLDRPYLEKTVFVYNGEKQTPKVLSPTKDYLEAGILLSGDTFAVDAGNYVITASLMETHDITYLWGDLSTDEVRLTWKITPLDVEIPKAAPLEFEYNGGSQFPVITGYNSKYVGITSDSTTSAVNCGNYRIEFYLKNTKSLNWVGGGTADIGYNWLIKKKSLDVNADDISLDETKYMFDTEPHRPDIVNFDSAAMSCVGYDYKTNYGEYKITVTPKENYTWSGGGSAPVVLEWRINKRILEIPDVSPKVFEYDALEKEPVSSEYNSDYISYDGDKKKTAVGNYTVVFSLKYKHSCEWADGSVDDVPIDWEITPISVKVPRIENVLFTYDGERHAPDIIDCDETYVKISGTQSALDADKYEIIFSLKDPVSCSWEDGIEGERAYAWEIVKKQLKKPHLEPTVFVYNNGTRRTAIKGFDDEVMIKDGVESAVDANSYTVTVSLKDTKNYEWADGTADSVELDWVIKKRPEEKPTVYPVSFIYDGQNHRPDMLGYRAASMTRSGFDYKSLIGEYIVTVSLNPNYEWSDGGCEPLELTWRIVRDAVGIPEVKNLDFLYDGTVHAPVIGEYNAGAVKQTGLSSAVNAGNYALVFSLIDKEHAVWTDGTSEDIIVPWNIRKAKLSLEVTNTRFDYNGGLHLPTVSGFDTRLMSYGTGSVLQAVDAGVYKFSVVLKDKTNYVWDDGTSDNKSYTWVIDRKTVTMPYLVPDVFEYDGKSHSPEVRGFNSEIMYFPLGSENGETGVGGYNVVVALGVYNYESKGYINKNFKWADGSTENLRLGWQIVPKKMKYPVLVKDEYEYNGSYQIPEAYGFSTACMRAVGDVSKKDCGDYNIGFVLLDGKNFVWEDGVVEGTLIPWKIVRAKINKADFTPVQNPVLV